MFQTGVFPDLDLSFLFCPFLSFFGPFWDFPDFSGIFPICSGMVRGFSRFVFFLFLGLLGAPTRNSPERVRDTIWTFPEKSGKHPGLETPGFSFSQILIYLVSVSCCCGLCVPNMIIAKANAKENVGESICLSITKAKAK